MFNFLLKQACIKKKKNGSVSVDHYEFAQLKEKIFVFSQGYTLVMTQEKPEMPAKQSLKIQSRLSGPQYLLDSLFGLIVLCLKSKNKIAVEFNRRRRSPALSLTLYASAVKDWWERT